MTFLGHKAPPSKHCSYTSFDASHKLKSELSLDEQIRLATSSSLADRHKMQALQGLAGGDDDDMENGYHPASKPLNPSRPPNINRPSTAQPCISTKPIGSNRRNVIADVSDVLDGFALPERPRPFKTEPVELDWDGLPPAKSAHVSNKRKRDSQELQHLRQDTPSRRLSETSTNGHRITPQPSTKRPKPASSDVVDLTDDIAESSQPIVVTNPAIPKPLFRGLLPRPLTDEQSTLMNYIDVPHDTLQQAREIYRTEGIVLPQSISKWQQLRDFVLEHMGPRAQFTPQLCTAAQAHAFWNATGEIANQIRQFAASFGQTIELAGTPLETKNSATLSRNGLVPASTRRQVIKTENNDSSVGNDKTREALRTPRSYLELPGKSIDSPLHPPSAQPRKYRTSLEISRSVPSPEQISAELKPSNALVTLLPPDSPDRCPRLRELWKPTLLRLPRSMHDHLTLQDTIVSILYRYDDKTHSAITAFLNDKASPHFFFLFKPRNAKLHSWSIEREEDVLTVGIERQRAPNLNTSEALRPSAGQYDITVRFRLASTTDAAPASEALEADHTAQDSPPLASRQWILIETSIFPSSPSLTTFLYDTPPTRGADAHETYKHPHQTPFLPASHLSKFARYLQQTAFCTSAMDGEFQLSHGRKVRYDASLGRVRVVWEYALKGARTQKEKRERGEYNRGANGVKTNAQTGVQGDESQALPGSGVARNYLAGSSGVASEATGLETGDFEDEETVENGRGADEQEHISKQAKMIRMSRRNRGGISASEYDGESGSE